jgi:hypothetical protein
LLQSIPFVQAAAARTAWKQRRRSIFKFERTNHATQPVTQCALLAPAAAPLTNYPEKKNRGKGKEQINCDQGSKADSDHGAGVLVGSAAAGSAKTAVG